MTKFDRVEHPYFAINNFSWLNLSLLVTNGAIILLPLSNFFSKLFKFGSYIGLE